MQYYAINVRDYSETLHEHLFPQLIYFEIFEISVPKYF